MKDIYRQSQLQDAIETLTKAVAELDEMIKIMQDNQKTLRSWLEPQEKIGWIEENEEMR